jgi:histone H2B
MENYEIYIRRALKTVHPDCRISNDAVLLIQCIVHHLMSKISHQAATLAQTNDAKTVTSRDVQAAVRLVIGGELAKHAVSQSTKAVTNFTSQNKTKPLFSTARTEKLMRRTIGVLRIGETAPVYVAAVAEYIACELLELAGMKCLDKNMKTIMTSHIKQAVVEDEEVHTLMRNLRLVLPGVKDQSNKKEDVTSVGIEWVV